MTVDERNAATSRQEVADFIASPPDRYFAYWNARGRWSQAGVPAALIARDLITTWTGDQLGKITWTGGPFYSSTDRRQNFRAIGINGATYSGTAYLSAGDYVRMRKVAA